MATNRRLQVCICHDSVLLRPPARRGRPELGRQQVDSLPFPSHGVPPNVTALRTSPHSRPGPPVSPPSLRTRAALHRPECPHYQARISSGTATDPLVGSCPSPPRVSPSTPSSDGGRTANAAVGGGWDPCAVLGSRGGLRRPSLHRPTRFLRVLGRPDAMARDLCKASPAWEHHPPPRCPIGHLGLPRPTDRARELGFEPLPGCDRS